MSDFADVTAPEVQEQPDHPAQQCWEAHPGVPHTIVIQPPPPVPDVAGHDLDRLPAIAGAPSARDAVAEAARQSRVEAAPDLAALTNAVVALTNSMDRLAQALVARDES